eukprot:gene29331-34361_t
MCATVTVIVTVSVAGCEQAPHIVIATGGYPTLGDIPGAELAIDSDGFFDLEDLPKRVAVVGAGYIAVEMAGILNSLGSDVSLMIRGPEVLKNFDHTIRGKLMDVMDDTGIDIKPHTALSALSKQSDGAIKIDYMQHDGSGGDAT